MLIVHLDLFNLRPKIHNYHTLQRIHTHTYIHTYTYTYTHTNICIHTRTRTLIRSISDPKSSSSAVPSSCGFIRACICIFFHLICLSPVKSIREMYAHIYPFIFLSIYLLSIIHKCVNTDSFTYLFIHCTFTHVCISVHLSFYPSTCYPFFTNVRIYIYPSLYPTQKTARNLAGVEPVRWNPADLNPGSLKWVKTRKYFIPKVMVQIK